MPSSAPFRRCRRGVVLGLGALTLVCFAVATLARIAVDRLLDETVTAAVGAGPSAWLDVAAIIGVGAVGSGVLLYGTTLVAAVLHQRGTRLPVWLGVVTLALVLAAVGTGLGASGPVGVGTVATLATLRIAFTGLATATLPAIALGAVRAHGDRSRHASG